MDDALTDKSLFRVLLNCPMLEKADAAEGRLAFVERLAALLAIDRDEGEEDLDLVRLHLATLDLILLLALSHEDAIVLLTKSASLLTRLVVRIYKDAALIHEHDGARFDDAPAYRTACVACSVLRVAVRQQSKRTASSSARQLPFGSFISSPAHPPPFSTSVRLSIVKLSSLAREGCSALAWAGWPMPFHRIGYRRRRPKRSRM